MSDAKKPPFRARFAAFATDIGRSCYDMEQYRAFRARPWQDAARYLAAFLGLLAVAVFVAFTVVAAPAPVRLAEHFRTALPDGAVFTIADKKLSVAGLAEGEPLQAGTDKFPFFVDVSIEGTEELPADAPKEGIVAGRDAVFLREGGETVSKQDYSSLQDGSMTKEQVLATLDSYGFLAVAAAAIAFTVAHLLFLSVNVAWFAIFGAWISYAIGKMWRVQLTFRQWVAVGLHAVTLPILVDHAAWLLSWDIPYVFPFLYFMVMIAVLMDERQSPTVRTAEAE